MIVRFGCLPACAVACSSLKSIPPADHVVRAPISGRANVVLNNLVTEYGSADGRWLRSMSPGCTQIWATQFGYRAGVRRDRRDILAIGQATAKHQSSDIRGLFWDALFGDVDRDDPVIFGFPALLVSGALGGRGIDKTVFSVGLDRLYGDSFGIDPVPALPKRDRPEKRRLKGFDHELVLGAGTDGQPGTAKFTISPLEPRGRLLFKHATRDVSITFEYEVLSSEQLDPLGGMELRYRARGKDARFENKYTLRFPFDAEGVAALQHYYCFEPLTYNVVFSKREDGKLQGVFRLREGPG